MQAENARAGQELLTVMLNIKKMVDMTNFSEIGNTVDDFDPMAMQSELPNKPKNKGMGFLKSGGKKNNEADLLDGTPLEANKEDKPVQNSPKKKGAAFNFIKKKSTEKPPQENTQPKNNNMGLLDMDFDLTSGTNNGQQVQDSGDLLGDQNMNVIPNNIPQNNTAYNPPNNDMFDFGGNDLLNSGPTNNVNTNNQNMGINTGISFTPPTGIQYDISKPNMMDEFDIAGEYKKNNPQQPKTAPKKDAFDFLADLI